MQMSARQPPLQPLVQPPVQLIGQQYQAWESLAKRMADTVKKDLAEMVKTTVAQEIKGISLGVGRLRDEVADLVHDVHMLSSRQRWVESSLGASQMEMQKRAGDPPRGDSPRGQEVDDFAATTPCPDSPWKPRQQ